MGTFDTARARVRIPSHVRATVGSDGGVLLDLERGTYLSLNRTGGHIWAALANGTAPEAIATDLAARCRADEDRVRRDLERFLVQLEEKGLVRREPR